MTGSGFFPNTVIGPFRAAGQIEQWDLTKPDPSGFRHWESGQYKPSAKGIFDLPIDGSKPPDALVGGFQAQKESGTALDFGQTTIEDTGFITNTIAITFNLGEVNFNTASYFNIMVSDDTVGTEFKAANLRFWIDSQAAFSGYNPRFYFLTSNAWSGSFVMTSGTPGAIPLPSSMPGTQNVFVDHNSDVFVSGSYRETELTHFMYVMAEFPNEPDGYVLGTYGGLGSGTFTFKFSYDWTGIDANVRLTDLLNCNEDS